MSLQMYHKLGMVCKSNHDCNFLFLADFQNCEFCLCVCRSTNVECVPDISFLLLYQMTCNLWSSYAKMPYIYFVRTILSHLPLYQLINKFLVVCRQLDDPYGFTGDHWQNAAMLQCTYYWYPHNVFIPACFCIQLEIKLATTATGKNLCFNFRKFFILQICAQHPLQLGECVLKQHFSQIYLI